MGCGKRRFVSKRWICESVLPGLLRAEGQAREAAFRAPFARTATYAGRYCTGQLSGRNERYRLDREGCNSWLASEVTESTTRLRASLPRPPNLKPQCWRTAASCFRAHPDSNEALQLVQQGPPVALHCRLLRRICFVKPMHSYECRSDHLRIPVRSAKGADLLVGLPDSFRPKRSVPGSV